MEIYFSVRSGTLSRVNILVNLGLIYSRAMVLSIDRGNLRSMGEGMKIVLKKVNMKITYPLSVKLQFGNRKEIS